MEIKYVVGHFCFYDIDLFDSQFIHTYYKGCLTGNPLADVILYIVQGICYDMLCY